MEKRRREDNFYFNLLTSRKGIRRNSNKRSRKQDLFPRSRIKSSVDSQRDDFEYVDVSKKAVALRGESKIEEYTVLPDFMQTNLKLMRYVKFAPVQRFVIPVATELERNVMCCAPTGSGKTLAFMIPALVRIQKEMDSPKRRRFHNKASAPLGLILAPTRELAIQIHEVSRRLLFREEERIRSVVVYGGSKIRPQLIELALGCDILIATPGRLKDMQSRGIVSLKDVRVFVLDEADRMLDMGFRPDVDTIHALCSQESRQTIMISATFPEAVQNLASSYMSGHYVFVRRKGEKTLQQNDEQNSTITTSSSISILKRIKYLYHSCTLQEDHSNTNTFDHYKILNSNTQTHEHTGTVTQRILRAETGSAKEKFMMLARLLAKDMSARRQVLVFVQRKDTAKWLARELRRAVSEKKEEEQIWSPEVKNRVNVVEIDGDRKQAQRLNALKSFNERRASILVATDVASRGLDTVGVDHVVNWSLHTNKSEFVASYVHRIGRTGRMGRNGIATSFYVPGENSSNGGCASIAPFLHRMFLSSNQKVPKWFENLPEASVSLIEEEEDVEKDFPPMKEDDEVVSTDSKKRPLSTKKKRRRKKKKKRKVNPIASLQGTFEVPSDW